MRATSGSASRILFAVLSMGLLQSRAAAEPSYSLKSPDSRIEVQIHVTNRIAYDVLLKDKLLLKDSTLSINIDGKTLGENPQVKSTKKDSVDRVLEPVVRQKFAKIRERYNQLRLELEGGYAVV